MGAWWGNRPLTPASRPQAHSPQAFPDSPSGPRLEDVTLTSHLASGWAPSLSSPTRKEEDVFSQGEGLAVPGPRDLRARVSMDVAGQGDGAVDDGSDLLRVRTCDAWGGCPHSRQEKERSMRMHSRRGPRATAWNMASRSSWCLALVRLRTRPWTTPPCVITASQMRTRGSEIREGESPPQSHTVDQGQS